MVKLDFGGFILQDVLTTMADDEALRSLFLALPATYFRDHVTP
jgi:hypothetical protein